jgi:hypothetical protein
VAFAVAEAFAVPDPLANEVELVVAESTVLTLSQSWQALKSIVPGLVELAKYNPGVVPFLDGWNRGHLMASVEGAAFPAIAVHKLTICLLRWYSAAVELQEFLPDKSKAMLPKT